MRKIVIAPKTERDAFVIAKVRKLCFQKNKLVVRQTKTETLLKKLHEQIASLQERCPHRRKKWWYGDIGEGWVCQDCEKDG